MASYSVRDRSLSFTDMEPISPLERTQAAVHAYVGSRNYSLCYSSSLTDRVWHAFCECVVAIVSLFSNIKASRESASVEGFKAIAKDLNSQILTAQKLLSSEDVELKRQGLQLFKQLVLIKAKIELSDNYAALYDESLGKTINDLKAQIAHRSFNLLPRTKQEDILAKLQHFESRYKRENQGFKSTEYQAFVQGMSGLKAQAITVKDSGLLLAASKLSPNALRNENEEKAYQLLRWAEGCDLQFQLAVMCPTQQLPYRAEEVPKGAVLLMNGDLYLQSKTLRKIPVGFGDWFHLVEAKIHELSIGSRALHTELSLGNGKIIHQKKGSQDFLEGSTKIYDRLSRADRFDRRQPVVLTHDILIPKMSRISPTSSATPDATLDRIVEKCEAGGYNVKLTKSSVYRAGLANFIPCRPRDYKAISPLKDHDPKNPERTQALCCSAFIASVYADHGMDLTRGTSKTLETFDPGDFAHSEYFEPAFQSGHL